MKKDIYKTRVIFRVFKKEVNALFPELSYKQNYKTQGYAHMGQHFECDYNHIVRNSRLATPDEYKDLFNELESIGYNLTVRTKVKIKYL